MNNNNSLKDYYVKLQELYSNVVNILTAINQSFHTSASEVTVNYTDTDNVSQSIRIPSFLYLESKIEQLDSNMSNLFKMPKSGEAWFSRTNDMYKLELVQSNTAPSTPIIDTQDIFAQVKDTNILKDMVNPKTFLKLNINNLPDNIEQIFMKKIIINSQDLFSAIQDASLSSYEEYKAYLYNLTNGKDYEEYDSVLDLPIKVDEYKSSFKIIDIPTDQTTGEQNPYRNEYGNLVYKLVFDTILYTDQEDSSIEFTLHPGQLLSLSNDYVIYKVLSVNTTIINNVKQHEVIIEEQVGHIALQTFEENSDMEMHIYNASYDKFHYVELPLEENEFIIVFLSTIYHNVRSTLSEPIVLDLRTIIMKDEFGNNIQRNGKDISYIDYYNLYCKNIGDLLLGISNTAYSQLSNYSTTELKELQDGLTMQSYVSATINNDALKVQRINTHLIDDEYSAKLINLHAEKNELNAQLSALQDNIDDTYNQLVSTDSQDLVSSRENLKAQLNEYYNQRIQLQKEIISIVDNINVLKTNVYGTADAKYRVRGNAVISDIEDYVKSTYTNCELIGLEYEYRYKSITKDTSNVQNINSTIFTEWNRVVNTDKERKLVFDSVTNTYSTNYVNYSQSENVTKWNQIDIPISQGEDVVIKVRYKYSVGQPFINLYTPWSDEFTVQFPVEFNDSLELTSIIEQNDNDTITAAFNRTLLNDGYQEHISNKVIDNSQVYFHMPENIYSGFNTPENKYISLKDKLLSLTSDISKYKSLFETDSMAKYKVYLEWDNNSIEINSNTSNKIIINETANIKLNQDTFTKKDMNIVIRNVGDIPVKLYSIMPGTTTIPLYKSNGKYDNIVENYESVPLLYGEASDIKECLYIQKLGQWIYFRNDNPYNQISNYDMVQHDSNGAAIYNRQRVADKQAYFDKDFKNNGGFLLDSQIYISNVLKLDTHMSLPFRFRRSIHERFLDSAYGLSGSNIENFIYNSDAKSWIPKNSTKDTTETDNATDTVYYDYSDVNEDQFRYVFNNNAHSNALILKYENISVHQVGNDENKFDQLIYLNNYDSSLSFTALQSAKATISNFESNGSIKSSTLCGAFFVPQLKSKDYLLCEDENYYKEIAVGDSISIPLLFEYFINEEKHEVTKTLHFDIKTALSKEIAHYEISVNCVYNYMNYIEPDENITASNTDALLNSVG